MYQTLFRYRQDPGPQGAYCVVEEQTINKETGEQTKQYLPLIRLKGYEQGVLLDSNLTTGCCLCGGWGRLFEEEIRDLGPKEKEKAGDGTC